MKFKALASSSHGNAYIVSDNDTRILLECGVSHKNLQKLSGFSLSEFQACLVSHEHKDHAKAVADLVEAQFPKLNGKVEINHIGTTIGSHTGPGTVALFFWGAERID